MVCGCAAALCARRRRLANVLGCFLAAAAAGKQREDGCRRGFASAWACSRVAVRTTDACSCCRSHAIFVTSLTRDLFTPCSEILSNIKGTAAAADAGGCLSRAAYASLPAKAAPLYLDPEQRGLVYSLFEAYTKALKAYDWMDPKDVAQRVFQAQRASPLGSTPHALDYVVVDEVQDFLGASLRWAVSTDSASQPPLFPACRLQRLT